MCQNEVRDAFRVHYTSSIFGSNFSSNPVRICILGILQARYDVLYDFPISTAKVKGINNRKD